MKRKRVTSKSYALDGKPPKRTFDSPSGRQGFETLAITPGGSNRVWHEDSAGAGTADPEAEKKRLEFNSQRDRDARKAARKKGAQKESGAASVAPISPGAGITELPNAPVSKKSARKAKHAAIMRQVRQRTTIADHQREATRKREAYANDHRGVSHYRPRRLWPFVPLTFSTSQSITPSFRRTTVI